jgi:hypothetical protein
LSPVTWFSGGKSVLPEHLPLGGSLDQQSQAMAEYSVDKDGDERGTYVDVGNPGVGVEFVPMSLP